MRLLLNGIAKHAINSFKHNKPILPSRKASQLHTVSYEGDARSTVTILSKEMDIGILIDAFSTYGFRLSNGISVVGPMILFPRSVMSWNVGGVKDINSKSLSLFTILDPKIDILVIGLGDNDISKVHDINLLKIIRSAGVNIEVHNTEQACACFNFMNAEGRNVAAALIPPHVINVTEDDMIKSRMKYKDPFERKGLFTN